LMQQSAAEFPEEHILMVNINHPLIQNLASMSQGTIVSAGGSASPTEQMTNLICQQVYDLALMAQKGFDADGMKSFVDRSNVLLTRLTEK
ncbi:MAG: molecular chaperone HtpG, partial [Leptolyngbya sp. SIO4C5]|nr:molecular chaperone HtpG [Leptolyngbya sp. SIO4C5]